jgi:glycosyltransferase involved in cell wall biosynthesis
VRVGLNLIYLVPGETGGTETFARELIPALRKVAPELELTAFINREAAADHDAPWAQLGSSVTVPVSATNRAAWVRGEQHLLPRLARRAGCELVHSLAATGPLRGSFQRVVTVHDLHYLIVPEAHSGLRGLGMRSLVPAAAHSAHRVFTDSTQTRRDLLEHYPRLDGSRIDVVPLGVRPPGPDVPRTPEAELRDRFGLVDRQVVLTASGKRPHKNIPALLEALALLDAPRPVLVVPGYATPHDHELRGRAEVLGLRADVRFPGWVPAGDLEGLYALATACVVPSLYEGFGLPVLEAMARGVPVACSDRGSLPEIAGQAALLFDPTDPREIAGALRRLLTDTELVAQLQGRGRAQAQRFSWEASARAHVAGYQQALAESRPMWGRAART